MSNSALNSYEKSEHLIDQDLDHIIGLWEQVKHQYRKQLKDNPKSWKGIGRGSELALLENHFSELGELLFVMTEEKGV